MSKDTEENNAQFVLNHFEEFVNHKNPAAADRNFSPSFVDHNPPGGTTTLSEGIALARRVFERFPDLRFEARDVLARGDKVMVRSVWIGHDASDGQLKEFHGFTLWRLQDGKIVERWATTSDLKVVEIDVFIW